MKYNLKKITGCLIIILCVVSYAQGGNESKSNILQSFYIIDYDVNLYAEKDSAEIKKKLTFFDPIVVLSDDVSPEWRIKIKLLDGMEGWVEEKYTSHVPAIWKKLTMLENYYSLYFSNKKLDIKKDELKQAKMYYYSNSDIDISMGVSYLSNYQQNIKRIQYTLNMQIKGGHDKELNWYREFAIDNYKVIYVITTDHENGGICESLDFVKLDEINIKKYYTVGVDYMPYESKMKKLMLRKILFSTLQSLK